MSETQESLHLLDYWRVIQSRKEIIIAVFFLVVLTGVFVTHLMKKEYVASTVIAVKEEKPDVPIWNPGIMRFDPLFLRTQFEILQSAPVLDEVIKRTQVDRVFARTFGYESLSPDKRYEQTFKLLQGRLKVHQYRETNLIQIRVFVRELGDVPEGAPQVAARLADVFAEVFRDMSVQKSRMATERALQALLESVEEQRKRVNEAEGRVNEIREKYKLNLLSSRDGSESSLDRITLARVEEARIKARMELEDKKSKHEKIASLSGKDVIDAAPYMVNDPAVASLVAKKRGAEVDLDTLRQASLGPRHPDVVALQTQITGLDQKINDAIEGLRKGIQADYEVAKTKVDALEKLKQDLEEGERSAESGGYREFNAAQQELEHARKIRNELEVRYLQEKIELRIPKTIVEVVEPARPPDADDYVSPKFLLNILLSILAGLAAGVGLAYFVEYLDTSIKTIEEVERLMNVPVLGVVPQKVKPFIDKGADGAHAEAYRMLRANLQFSEKWKNGKTMCVTSGSVGEGKSLTVFNLAYICAELGDKVLIIDADLHRPRQHKILGVSNKEGLTDVLLAEKTLEEAVVATGVPNLSFLPSGRRSTSVHGLLDSRRLGEVIKAAKEQYDRIFFDAPPIIGVSDASLLVREVDGVLQVIQHRKYPRSVSTRAKGLIQNVGGNLIGILLNNINISRDYSYYYYYHYYYPKDSTKGKKA